MHQSVATISSPQFLNLQPLDVNPLMSKCEIKVLYVGANRNHSFITKEVAAEIGKTLRGAPIVGYYRENKEDFEGHGEKIIFDDEGIHFECETKPYGFVSPVAQVWFQDFEDSDGMGNSITRTYLMTTGYLWTGQFPESSLPVDKGRPQSMELDKNTLEGSWETNLDNGMDYFIINDAVISKLCILGEDVQPCFEGASITAPNVSSQFTLDDNFKHTLYSMMQDLQNALKEGGQQMEDIKNIEVQAEDPAVETSEDFSENLDNGEENTPDIEETAEETVVENEFTEDSTEEENSESTEEENDTLTEKYSLLENDYNDLKEKYEKLTADYNVLIEFKKTVDNEKKDNLIAEFYMLDDEDKKDIIKNKENYSLEEIKAKLSMICFDKKISFSKEEKEEEKVVIYSLEDTDKDSNLPDWVKAVKEQEKLD